MDQETAEEEEAAQENADGNFRDNGRQSDNDFEEMQGQSEDQDLEGWKDVGDDEDDLEYGCMKKVTNAKVYWQKVLDYTVHTVRCDMVL